MERFTVTIEGLNWEDVEQVELPGLPGQGDLIETKYGTCVITSAELSPDRKHAGKIVCRIP